jgi:arylformamidase
MTDPSRAARFDPAWLTSMYDLRARVPQAPDHFERWARASAHARRTLACELDLRYGAGPDEVLDVFPAARPDAPVVVFVHGGFWRAFDKSDHSFVAPALVASGCCVVVPNYTLCPAITIPGIALQMVDALAWTWRNVARHGGDPSRIVAVGHSAGGHLAAMLLACRWPDRDPALPADLLTRAVAISGLFDLEPLRHVPFLADSLRLTEQDARRASPALMPSPQGRRLVAVAGALESPEFLRNNRLIRDAWGAGVVQRCEVLEGEDHFSILGGLEDPRSPLFALLRESIG